MKRFALLALFLLLPIGASAQMINEGFEEWREEGGQERPVGWAGSPVGVSSDNAARSGDRAVSVWNWYYYGLGYVVLGESAQLSLSLKHTGIPIDFVPTKLTGYYKYVLGQNSYNGEKKDDSAAVYVMVKRYNPESGDIDTISFAVKQFPPSSEWRSFSLDLPVKMQGVQPDSIAIAFYSSNPEKPAFCGPDSSVCCYLSVDDLDLSTTSGVRYDLDQFFTSARVVPNPMPRSGRIEFEGKAGADYRIRLFDAAGNEVLSDLFTGAAYEFTGTSLSAGVYYFSIIDAENRPQAAGEFVVQ